MDSASSASFKKGATEPKIVTLEGLWHPPWAGRGIKSPPGPSGGCFYLLDEARTVIRMQMRVRVFEPGF